MPVVFGECVSSVNAIVDVFRRHGDRVRGTYVARYVFDCHSSDPYRGATLERPSSLLENPSSVVYPWEQIFLSLATCAGSDYPMLAVHYSVPLDRVELVVEGVFDPRGQFDGLDGYRAPADAAPCFLSLHLRATLVSNGPRDLLEKIHQHVMATNMVLGALRGVPKTSELVVNALTASLLGR